MKYLVISYDPDQQQWFYDVVFAEDSEKAKERLCDIRDYVMDANVLSIEDLERITGRMHAATETECEAWLKELAAERE